MHDLEELEFAGWEVKKYKINVVDWDTKSVKEEEVEGLVKKGFGVRENCQFFPHDNLYVFTYKVDHLASGKRVHESASKGVALTFVDIICQYPEWETVRGADGELPEETKKRILFLKKWIEDPVAFFEKEGLLKSDNDEGSAT